MSSSSRVLSSPGLRFSAVTLLVAVFASGCDATFTYKGALDLGMSGVMHDTTSPTSDGVAGDANDANDGQGPAVDVGHPGVEETLADGTWQGWTGHQGAGGASLVRRADGRFELRLAADFSSSPVPGPVVVLSHRAGLGSNIDPALGDVNLGTLQAASGAQSYLLSGADGGQRYAWVFCQPFGIEIARALLEDRP